MSNVLVLGAGGQIARHVIGMLDGEQGVTLTLFARNTSRLARVPANATLVQGDVLDAALLAKAVKGQDIVWWHHMWHLYARISNCRAKIW